MVQLRDYTGQTVAITGTMEQATEQAKSLPQVTDIHDKTTGDTWSRPGAGAPWVWHWENW